MKKMMAIFWVIMLVCMLNVNAEEKVTSGKCGENAEWSYADGVLTISGSGAIADKPWREYKNNITKVVISKNITSIGDYAFEDCISLTEIEIPDSVTSIGNGAFYHCSSLTEIEIPDSVTSIGNGAFYYCSSLTEIEIPNGLTIISDNTFDHCLSLEKVRIPEGVTEIGDYAFCDCQCLNSIEIPNGVVSIGSCAFFRCGYFREIEIPNSVTRIGQQAFVACGNPTVYIPPSVVQMDSEIFNSTDPVIYARPGSTAYGYAIKYGYEVHDYYALNVGDVVDQIIDSDIYVTMNGELIPSYCVNGRTLILVRDLERYGFDVSFDEQNKIAYATFNPDKAPYEGVATKLTDRNVLHTDIRAIINGIEVEVRNTNGFVAVEAERLGNYVPEISCVWQPDYRRLQMQAFDDMASFEDLVNSISERKGISQSYGCKYFEDTDNGRFEVFVDKGYISRYDDYNGYVYPQRGLRIADFTLVAGRAYGLSYKNTGIKFKTNVPTYLSGYVNALYEKGIIIPDENNEIYLDGILTKAQMEYYLDMLEQG